MGLWDKRDDMIVHEREPYNAEPPCAALADRILTPLDTFYSRNHGAIPQVDAGDWQVTVDGLVDRPLTLSLTDLQKNFEPRTVIATLQCAGNRRAGLTEVRDIPGEDQWGPGATSTAEWTGVSLADVLSTAGLQATAKHVAFSAPDVSQLATPAAAYGGSIDTTKATSDEVILAWQMNGHALPPLHGGPVRVVVPGYIGARSVKWVQRITAQRDPSDNYFQATAYRVLPVDFDPDRAGPGDGISLTSVNVNSAILSPDDGARMPAGPTEISGYAFAGDDRGIARVDLSLDDGHLWAQAELDKQVSPWAWRHWRATVDLPPGRTQIAVRAWDTHAATQPESPQHLWNPKGYANNSWARIHLHAH